MKYLISILFYTIDKIELADFLLSASEIMCVEKRKSGIRLQMCNIKLS